MEGTFKDLLCTWRAPQLRVVLCLMAEHSKAWMGWAVPLGIDLYPVSDETHVYWVEAIDMLLQCPVGPVQGPLDRDPHEAMLRAMTLACVWMSVPAREILFGDSRLVYHDLHAKPPAQAEVERMLPLLKWHLNQWAKTGYREPAAFVQAVRSDWMFGALIGDRVPLGTPREGVQ